MEINVMELNKDIKLPFGLFDVSELGRDHRILYFKDEEKVVIKSCVRLALLDNEQKYNSRAEILTASQAVRRYPAVFTDTSKKSFDGDIRTIMLRVPKEMYVFCCQQGNITAFLRSLIEREMKKVV